MDKFWLKEPQEHDFPAAADYLELLFSIEESFLEYLKLKAIAECSTNQSIIIEF